MLVSEILCYIEEIASRKKSKFLPVLAVVEDRSKKLNPKIDWSGIRPEQLSSAPLSRRRGIKTYEASNLVPEKGANQFNYFLFLLLFLSLFPSFFFAQTKRPPNMLNPLLALVFVAQLASALRFDLQAASGHSSKNERCIRNFVLQDQLVVVTAIVDGKKGDGQVVNMHVCHDTRYNTTTHCVQDN